MRRAELRFCERPSHSGANASGPSMRCSDCVPWMRSAGVRRGYANEKVTQVTVSAFPQVRGAVWSRLSESNRRPSHYERPGNVHPGVAHAWNATHAMPETTPVAFRGYAGGKRMELNHAASRAAKRTLIVSSLPALGGPSVQACRAGWLSVPGSVEAPKGSCQVSLRASTRSGLGEVTGVRRGDPVGASGQHDALGTFAAELLQDIQPGLLGVEADAAGSPHPLSSSEVCRPTRPPCPPGARAGRERKPVRHPGRAPALGMDTTTASSRVCATSRCRSRSKPGGRS